MRVFVSLNGLRRALELEGKLLDFRILHLGLAELDYINIQYSNSSIVNAGSGGQCFPSLMGCGIRRYWQLSFL